MKERLTQMFIDWIIRETSIPMYDKNFELKEVFHMYPNSLKGLKFILDHCSCCRAVKDEINEVLHIIFVPWNEDPDELRMDGSHIQENTFDIIRHSWVTMPAPNGESYRKKKQNIADFGPILKDLIRYTFQRVPDYKIEQFLMDQL